MEVASWRQDPARIIVRHSPGIGKQKLMIQRVKDLDDKIDSLVKTPR